MYNTATAGTGAFSSSRDILLGLNIANSRPYDDGIDDIAIWNEALTTNEITALYNSGMPLTVTSNSGIIHHQPTSKLIGDIMKTLDLLPMI